MKRIQHIFSAVVASILTLQMTAPAQAGMSSIVLTEYGVARITGLSTSLFFGLVVSTLLVRFFWGLLVRETEWPKPTLVKSFAATFLGGLLFFLVLVMIAGSRELFSPGAWQPDGILYKLASHQDTGPDTTDAVSVSVTILSDIALARRQSLEPLRDHLRRAAESDDGLPTIIPQGASPQAADLWVIPFSSGVRYEYHPQPDDGPWLVVEPPYIEGQRHAIERATWEIVEVPLEMVP